MDAERKAYSAGLTLCWPGRTVFVGLRPHGFDLSFEPAPDLSFDPQGRLVRFAELDRTFRRSYSHRLLETEKRSLGARRIHRRLHDSERADQVVDAAAHLAGEVRDVLASGAATVRAAVPSTEQAMVLLQPLITLAAAFDANLARQEAARFDTIYRPIPILPPDQYSALVLQATEGCAHNRCLYCDFYRRTHFRVKSPDEFRTHVRQVIEYHGAELSRRRGIFLDQANALAIPQRRLLELFDVLEAHFEFPDPRVKVGPAFWRERPLRFDGIYSFLDAFSGIKKGTAELRALRERNLRRVYLGVETGDEELLRILEKPATNAAVLTLSRRLKEAEVALGVIILLGAGGERFFDRHVAETLALLERLELGAEDVVFLSPLKVAAGSRYLARASEEGMLPLSPERQETQRRLFMQALARQEDPRGPKVAGYDVEHFLY